MSRKKITFFHLPCTEAKNQLDSNSSIGESYCPSSRVVSHTQFLSWVSCCISRLNNLCEITMRSSLLMLSAVKKSVTNSGKVAIC